MASKVNPTNDGNSYKFVGMHAVLFFVSTYILVRRWKTSQAILLGAIFTMFALSTADVAITWRTVLRDLGIIITGDVNRIYKRIYPKFPIFVTNKYVPFPHILWI